MFDETRHIKECYSQSLVYTSFLELVGTYITQSFFLHVNCTRMLITNLYALEFIVQSYYIDTEYHDSDFKVITNVLAKIENDRNYCGTSLLKKLNLNPIIEKDTINEYYKLHKKVHITYKQFLYTAYHFMDDGHRLM